MTPNSWLAVVGSLIGMLGLTSWLAASYRRRWLDVVSRSDALLSRLNRAEGSIQRQIELGAYRVPPEKAPSVLKEIFRPMGVPSTERDAANARAWRERRAVTASDHLRRHFAEGAVPSAWATEVMQICVGPMEVEGE